jgi:hypothetical protein
LHPAAPSKLETNQPAQSIVLRVRRFAGQRDNVPPRDKMEMST